MPFVGEITPHVSSFTPNNATGPIDYTWTITPAGGGLIIPNAGAQHISVQWVAAGTYTLQLQTSNGCSSTSHSETFVVTTPPPQPVPIPVPVPVVPTPEPPVPVIVTPLPVFVPTPEPPVPVTPPTPEPPVPQPIPVPVTPPTPVVTTTYYEAERCDSPGIFERAVMTGFEGLPNGTFVKFSDGNCYQLIGTSTVLTTNTIQSTHGTCAECQGNVPTPIPVVVPTPEPPVPVDIPVPVTPPTPVTVDFWEFQHCTNGSTERASKVGFEGLSVGQAVSVNGECWTIIGSSTVFTSNVISQAHGNCAACQGVPPTPIEPPTPVNVPTPEPPVPVFVPTPEPPVPVDLVWNLQLCSDNSNATMQVASINLTAGVIIRDDDTGICYRTVNLNPIAFTLINNFSEHQDCASCAGTPPTPVFVPTPEPIPVPVTPPTVTCVQYRLTNDNAPTLEWTATHCTLGGTVNGFVAFGDTVITDCVVLDTLSYGGNSIPEGCGTPPPTPVNVPTPEPVPVPVEPPTPVGMAWNLRLCSNGEIATQQVDDMNLAPGVIVRDDVTGICYTVENLNPIAFTLIGAHSEHQDCNSCMGIAPPVPVEPPVPEPVPVPVEPPTPVCNCRIFIADNSSGGDITYSYTECGTSQFLTGALPNGGQIQGCLSSPDQFINDADGQSIAAVAGVTVNDSGVTCC